MSISTSLVKAVPEDLTVKPSKLRDKSEVDTSTYRTRLNKKASEVGSLLGFTATKMMVFDFNDLPQRSLNNAYPGTVIGLYSNKAKNRIGVCYFGIDSETIIEQVAIRAGVGAHGIVCMELLETVDVKIPKVALGETPKLIDIEDDTVFSADLLANFKASQEPVKPAKSVKTTFEMVTRPKYVIIDSPVSGPRETTQQEFDDIYADSYDAYDSAVSI